MAKQRPPWHVERDPAACRYAVFVSHVGEDAQEVIQLKAEIAACSGKGGRPALKRFLHVHDWLPRARPTPSWKSPGSSWIFMTKKYGSGGPSDGASTQGVS